MKPKIPTPKSASVRGSGPDGKIQIGDIRAKLGEIRGEVDETTDKAKPYVLYAGVAGAIFLVGVAFLLGRKRGKRKATWVEIRRL